LGRAVFVLRSIIGDGSFPYLYPKRAAIRFDCRIIVHILLV